MYLGEDGLARLRDIIYGRFDGLMVYEQTAKAASATFYPAPNSPLEVEFFFSCVETLPTGTKGSTNPSTVAGVSSADIVHGEEEISQPFGFECYGGSFNFKTGILTQTHAAVVPEASPVDISDLPVDTTAPGFIDTWGRTITAGSGGTSLTVSGDADGGVIVYKLATPVEIPLVKTPMFAPVIENRLGDVQSDSVSTSTGTIQVTFGSPAGRPATNAEIDAICASELSNAPLAAGLEFATTEYVRQQIANLVGSAPQALDTLVELGQALGNDPSFAATVAAQIGGKVSTGSSEYVSGASMSGVSLSLVKGDGSTETVALMPDAATDAEIDALFEEGE